MHYPSTEPQQPGHQGLSRRNFLRFGSLGLGGLMLADLLKLRAERKAPRAKSVIMVLLRGGPSHIDMYDMKPDAPVEVRGEFKTIATKAPGMRICELFPRQAQIADKLAIIRNMKFTGDNHSCEQLTTGWRSENRPNRPAHGAVVSFLNGRPSDVPKYVVLGPPMAPGPVYRDEFGPVYLGAAHRPFVPTGEAYRNMALLPEMTPERLGERKQLLRAFDTMRRDLDARGEAVGMDRFTAQAFELLTSNKARAALDVSREPGPIRQKYGITGTDDNRNAEATRWLQARRLVEAGVPVVNFACGHQESWDTHTSHFTHLRKDLLPKLDQGVSALVSDLHDRGLDQDVAVVVWGEMGRTPKVASGRLGGSGRDHWHDAGFALLAGGGWPMGQVIGRTDAWASRPAVTPYQPQDVLAAIYRHLGIDPATTVLDYSGRPQFLLEQYAPIKELL
ncbi:MAG: DUF1501 domain-containing protein [Tepidisphaerales bacterium]